MRMMLRPTVRGWGLLIAGTLLSGFGATTRRVELVWFGTAIIALVLVALLWGLVQLLRLSRHPLRRELDPRQAQVDREIRIDLQVPSSLPPWSRLTDRIGEPFERLDSGASTTVIPRRRGRFSLGPVILHQQDPYALAQWRRQLRGQDELIIWPRTTVLDRELFWRRVNRASGLGAGPPDESVDDITIREYQPGDPMERVHWKASARHGTLLVRQEQPGHTRRFHVLVIPGTEYAEPVVDLGASIVAELDRPDHDVTLHLPDPAGEIQPRGGTPAASAFTALALVPTGSSRPMSSEAPPARSVVVAVLGQPDLADALLAWVPSGATEALAYVPGPWRADVEPRFHHAGWVVETL